MRPFSQVAWAIAPALLMLVASAAGPRGPYFGQNPPGDTPEIFAPGFVSQAGRMERVMTFSPDQSMALFAVTSPDYKPTLFLTRQVNGVWTTPEVPSFATEGNNTEPAISADGRRIYFASNRPPGKPPYQFDLWMVERAADGWSTPTRLAPPISSEAADYHPTISAAGTLCFASPRNGNPDIFCARQSGSTPGVFEAPAPVGAVNTEHQEWDPFIAPDESYLIFKSDRPGGLGGMDGYISFRAPDGSWGAPCLLPAPLNTEGSDDVGDVSPDGRYLFFARRQGDDMDVYWVRADKVLAQAKAAADAGDCRQPGPTP